MDRSFKNARKLNDRVEYSEKEVDDLTWQEKTNLYRKIQ